MEELRINVFLGQALWPVAYLNHFANISLQQRLTVHGFKT